MRRTLLVVTLVVALLFIGCNIHVAPDSVKVEPASPSPGTQSPRQSSETEWQMPEHFTVHPKNNQASFELTPNSGCSVVVFLKENQAMNVNYLFSPTDFGNNSMTVKYTSPNGQQCACGSPGLHRGSFETINRGEGYYSIDFYYWLDMETMPFIDQLANITVTVRYDIITGK